jgi:hypothetical protein
VQRDCTWWRIRCQASHTVQLSQAVMHVGQVARLQARQLDLPQIGTWREGLKETGKPRGLRRRGALACLSRRSVLGRREDRSEEVGRRENGSEERNNTAVLNGHTAYTMRDYVE